jgi:hypothetical protein
VKGIFSHRGGLRGAFVGASALAAVAVFAPARADGPASFVADKVERFDGKSWSGLTFGAVTQDGIKKQFRNGRGEFSSSVELQQDGSQGYKVSALFPSKDKNAKLDGIAIRFKSDSDGLPLDGLTQSLGDGGETFFPADARYEDWRVVAYPSRGVLLFAVGDRVPLVLLGEPARIAEAATLLGKDETPVTEYVDPHKDEPRVVTFGSYDVDFDISGDLRVRDREGERRDIEREIRSSSRAGGDLRYDPGASGSYKVSVTARNKRDKGGDGSVSVSISGSGPYGAISASGYESFRIDRTDEDTQELEDTRYNQAVYAAMREAENDLAQKLRKQGPPPIDSFRRAWWDKVIDKYRFHTAGASGTGEGGKPGGLL